MKKIILLSFLLSSGFVFANRTLTDDIKVIEKDIVKTGFDFWVLLDDTGKCLKANVPSTETLLVDGSFDGFLRQFKPLNDFVKGLEKVNPVNGAIVRDFSKMLTIFVKTYFKLPVDQTGRQYDIADVYSQFVKLSSKAAGFAGLYFCGGLQNAYLIPVVNNGGDVLSQAIMDSGKAWRKNPTVSFDEYLIENYSVKSSMVSVPAKGGVSYAIGWLMQKIPIVDAVEAFLLVLLNQATKAKLEKTTSLVWANNLGFAPGFIIATSLSVVKSLILTTFCKSSTDGTNYIVNNVDFKALIPQMPAQPEVPKEDPAKKEEL